MNSGVPAQPTSQGIKSIKIVSPHQGWHARIARLSWAKAPDSDDASLYIEPYSGAGWSVKGHSAAAISPGAATDLTVQREYPNAKFGNAQLSLHHSGQSHVYVGPHRQEFRLPPVEGARLDDPAGGHVATISWATLDGLPTPDRPVVSAGPNIDFVVPAVPDAARFSLVLYSGTDADAMRERHPFLQENPMLRMDRLGMSSPLFFGFRCRVDRGPRQDPPGVMVLGGWGPGASPDDSVPGVAVWVGP